MTVFMLFDLDRPIQDDLEFCPECDQDEMFDHEHYEFESIYFEPGESLTVWDRKETFKVHKVKQYLGDLDRGYKYHDIHLFGRWES